MLMGFLGGCSPKHGNVYEVFTKTRGWSNIKALSGGDHVFIESLSQMGPKDKITLWWTNIAMENGYL